MQRLWLSALTLLLLGGLVRFIASVSSVSARRVWLILFTVVVGGGVTMMTTHANVSKWGFHLQSPRYGLIRLMDGTADRPFVYRRLMPEVVNVVTDRMLRALPERTFRFITVSSPLRRYRDRAWMGDPRQDWTRREAVAFHVAYIVSWCASLGTLIALTVLSRSVPGYSSLAAVVAATIALALAPLLLEGGAHLYDVPELLFWSVLLLAASRGWMSVVACSFALLMLNKESGVLVLPALFALLRARHRVAVAAAWTSLLGLLGALWIVFLWWRFADRGGTPAEWWLPFNLRFYGEPMAYLRFDGLFAPVLPSPAGGNVIVLLFLLVPLRFGWRSTPETIRRATLLTAAVLTPAFVMFGCGDEIRGLALLMPPTYLIILHGVRELFAGDLESVAPRETALASSPAELEDASRAGGASSTRHARGAGSHDAPRRFVR